MTAVPGINPGLIQQEEVFFKSAVSEFTMTRMAQFFNFLSQKEHSEKQFFINGKYGSVSIPHLGVDGLAVFEFDAEIFNVWMFNYNAGSSGTTELDLKIATTSGGSFTSIFSTTPKTTPSAGNNVWFGIGSTVSGTTAPVLTSGSNPLQVTAGTAIRCDKLQAMVGAENCGILVHYRPR